MKQKLLLKQEKRDNAISLLPQKWLFCLLTLMLAIFGAGQANAEVVTWTAANQSYTGGGSLVDNDVLKVQIGPGTWSYDSGRGGITNYSQGGVSYDTDAGAFIAITPKVNIEFSLSTYSSASNVNLVMYDDANSSVMIKDFRQKGHCTNDFGILKANKTYIIYGRYFKSTGNLEYIFFKSFTATTSSCTNANHTIYDGTTVGTGSDGFQTAFSKFYEIANKEQYHFTFHIDGGNTTWKNWFLTAAKSKMHNGDTGWDNQELLWLRADKCGGSGFHLYRNSMNEELNANADNISTFGNDSYDADLSNADVDMTVTYADNKLFIYATTTGTSGAKYYLTGVKDADNGGNPIQLFFGVEAAKITNLTAEKKDAVYQNKAVYSGDNNSSSRGTFDILSTDDIVYPYYLSGTEKITYVSSGQSIKIKATANSGSSFDSIGNSKNNPRTWTQGDTDDHTFYVKFKDYTGPQITFSAPKLFGWADPNNTGKSGVTSMITAFNVTQNKDITSGEYVNDGDEIIFTAHQYSYNNSQTNGDATIGQGRLVLNSWNVNGEEKHDNIPSTGIVWFDATSQYTCTANSDIDVQAIYGLNYVCEILTSSNGSATASVGSQGIGAGSGMKSGTEITLVATPNQGYTFDHWEGKLYGTDPNTSVWTDNNWSTSSTFTFTIDSENTFDYAYGYDIKVTPVFKEATPELKQPSTILTKVSGQTSYTINLKEQVNNLKSSDAVTYDSPTIIKDGNTPSDGVNATSNLSASISGDNLIINSANDVDGGAVVVNVKVNGNKIGNYIINVPYIGNHTWDFHQMANKSEHSTSGDFILDYEVVEGSTYKNPMTVYNSKVDGNNAAIIDATNGLSITTGNKNNMSLAAIGPTTTSTSKASLADVTGVWLVGMKNATLTIPQVKKDWFIKMYLLPHSGASQASGAGTEFTVNNLKDLNGKEINPNHTLVTNGVFRNNNIMDLIHDKGNIQGCMIFRVKENGNVDFNFSNNGWDKIVKIVVADTYSTELMLGCTGTDTKVVDYFRHNHNLVYREYDSSYGKTNTTAVATYNGHPQVHAENAKYIDMTISKYTTDATGKQIQGSITGATMENYQWTSGGGVTYQGGKISANNGVGNIKVISNATYSGMVKDNGWEAKDSYVLNSNESWLAVGKLKVQKYPYTWDFTKYNTEKGTTAASISSNIESVPNDTLYGAWSTGGWYNKVVKVYGTPGETSPYYRVDATGKKIYDIEIVKPLFAFGSQLTYGTTAIPETEGLGITPYDAYYVSGDYSHTGTTSQNQITLSNGDNMSFTKVVTVTIPEVPAGMYVFVKSSNAPTTVTNTKSSDVTFAPNADGNVYYYQAEADGDINITLPASTSVYRIGVTDQVKEFTTYHWTTESRALDIDYNETPQFSANVKTYYTANNAYNSSEAMVTLNEVTSQTHIPAGTGLIMHDLQTTDATVVKVPLFVPAVNIAPTAQTGFSTASEGVLVGTTKADGSNNTVYKSVAGAGNYSYFTLSNLIKTINPADYGITIDTEKEVLPGFYRYVGSDVNINNKAFIKLPSTSVSAKSSDCIFLNFADGSSTNINIIGTNGIVELQDAKMYNLQGIRVNSANKGGIYIINGKKVFIKK